MKMASTTGGVDNSELRRRDAMALVSFPAPLSAWENPPMDADEFELWRCATVFETVVDGKIECGPCGAEIKRKSDGSLTRDPRWAVKA
mgnify:FL=1